LSDLAGCQRRHDLERRKIFASHIWGIWDMHIHCLSKFAITCLLTLSPLAAEAASPSLYALSKRPGSAEILTYDLNQALTFPLFTYEPNTIAPIDASALGPDTIASIGVSGHNLYALSQRPGSDEILTYDLNQALTFPSFTYEPNTIAPIDASALGPDTIASIGVSGNNLYALSKRPGSDEILTYDLNQALTFPSFTYEPNTIAPIDASALGPDTIIAIATDGTPSGGAGGGGGGSTPVPEPSTYALMMIGVMALAALKGRRLRPVWNRA
jgi:predicted metal-dependent enzyme (double-stranded beta helix superfamily)